MIPAYTAVMDCIYTPISNSNRAHKYTKLDNGITALLISDASDKSAAICVSVGCGSHIDPSCAPGLAHLCEHMIVSSGSKRFPDPGTYHKFLVEHNGNQNAFTTGEQTSFYFELPNSNNSVDGVPIFDKLVGILADKLKSPIFQNISILKEVFAVDSEHENNKNVVSKIMLQGLKILANRNSSFARFTTGNVNTLVNSPRIAKLEVRHLLEQYFQEQYTADKMCVVIRGPHSINYLNKLVNFSFKGLKASPSRIDSTFQKLGTIWSNRYEQTLFPKDSLNTNGIIIQNSKNPVLSLVLPVSSNVGNFSRLMAKNFMRIWSDLFGDEGPGSICSHFKSKNFINQQTAQLLKLTYTDNALVLKFNMTTAGWKTGIKYILSQIFNHFLPLILKMDAEDLAVYINEWNTINFLRFLYQDTEVSLMDKCSDLASKLLDCDAPEFILNGGISLPCNFVRSEIGSFYEDENSRIWWISLAREFQSFLQTYMTWENCKVIFIGEVKRSQIFNELDEFNFQLDEFYNFKFWKRMIMLDSNVSFFPDLNFSLPNSHEYVLNLDKNLYHLKQSLQTILMKSQSSSLSLTTQSDISKTKPRLAGKNDVYELWVKEEDLLTFNSRTIVTVELINLFLKPSAEATMNLEILAQILYFDISAQLYPAERVGYMYEIIPNNRGDVRLSFTISGFPQGVYKILKVIVDQIMMISQPNYEITKETFRKSRVVLRNKYEEASRANSCTLASIGVLIMLERCFWTLEQRLEALEEIDINNFKNFCQNMCTPQTNYLNLIVQGDISYLDHMNQYLNQHTGHLLENQQPLHYGTRTELETISLPKGSNFYVQLPSFEDDPTNSIVYFLETGSRDNEVEYSIASFFEFFMSMTLTPDLRTKKQIGYIVLGGLRLLTSTLGIHISVMSNMCPATLETKINEYLEELETSVLRTMTQAEFHSKYLHKYIQLIESNSLQKLTKSSGPANLMTQIEANIHSANFPASQHFNYTLQQHKRFSQEISFRTYNFQDEKLDLHYLKTLTLPQFNQFFAERISIKSKVRRKLSVMFRSPMNSTQLTSALLLMNLECFLKLNGFHINRDDLKSIIQKTNGRPMLLFKTLLRHFGSQGQSLRLCATILKEIFKQFFNSDLSLTTKNFNDPANLPTIPLKEITNVQHFKAQF